ncbi:hypothetical protein GY45DRAFT_1321115 [Cubamyces sp. BRFM 1775]|nr:hypothetical protein GY45DRAFT_1321115 [Cubamyces sp. BRFM 1775]
MAAMEQSTSTSAALTTVLPDVTLDAFVTYAQPSEPCYNGTATSYLRRPDGTHPNIGVVLAGVFGGIGGGLLLIVLFWLYLRKRGRYAQLSDEEKQPFAEIHPFMSWRSPVPGTGPAKREGESARQQTTGLPPVPAHKSSLPQSMQPVAASPERERRGRTRYYPRPSREGNDLGRLRSTEHPREGAPIPRKKRPAKVLSHGGRTVDWEPDVKKCQT